MTSNRRAFSLDGAGALSFQRSIGGLTLPRIGLSKKAVRLDKSGVSLGSGIELQDGIIQLVLPQQGAPAIQCEAGALAAVGLPAEVSGDLPFRGRGLFVACLRFQCGQLHMQAGLVGLE